MIRLQDALRTATATLEVAGVPSSAHDARALAAHALGLARPGDLVLVDELGDAQPAFEELVARRAQRVPLQHLVGSVGFRHLELAVGPGVFTPRPETESVVQWAVDRLVRLGLPAPLCVDLCAGSGTIAFALANEVPGAVVHAVERDPAALAWAHRNAALRIAAGDPEVQLHLGRAEHALPDLAGRVDLVASNPPYVATADFLEPEVVDHEPGIALWAGEDGLDGLRIVESAARRLLRPGGLLVAEHADRHGESAPGLLRAAGGWEDVADHRDLAGRDRFVTARRSGPGSTA